MFGHWELLEAYLSEAGREARIETHTKLSIRQAGASGIRFPAA